MLPFDRAEFFEVFARYNAAVWPLQVAAYLLAAAMVAALGSRSRGAARWIAAGLAAMWLWTGIAYHALHFAPVNPVAYGFGAAFALQGGLLALAAIGGRLRFAPPADGTGWLGAALVAYAAIGYPLAGVLGGHAYPAVPMFGITPCPLTLFTFGLLLLATSGVPRRLLVVPFAWSLVGGSAAFVLGVPQDLVLLASALSVPLIVRHARRGAHGAQLPVKVGR